MHEHPIERIHDGKLVNASTVILDEGDDVLLDANQEGAALGVVPQSLQQELLRVYATEVGVEFRTRVWRSVWVERKEIRETDRNAGSPSVGGSLRGQQRLLVTQQAKPFASPEQEDRAKKSSSSRGAEEGLTA